MPSAALAPAAVSPSTTPTPARPAPAPPREGRWAHPAPLHLARPEGGSVEEHILRGLD